MMMPPEGERGWLMTMVFGTHLQNGIINWMRKQMDPAYDFARLLRTRFHKQIQSMRFQYEHNGMFWPRLEVIIRKEEGPNVLHAINEAVTTFFGAFINVQNAIAQGAHRDLTSESFRTQVFEQALTRDKDCIMIARGQTEARLLSQQRATGRASMPAI